MNKLIINEELGIMYYEEDVNLSSQCYVMERDELNTNELLVPFVGDKYIVSVADMNGGYIDKGRYHVHEFKTPSCTNLKISFHDGVNPQCIISAYSIDEYIDIDCGEEDKEVFIARKLLK